MTPVRVVIDTNCLVSALIYSLGGTGRLRHLWQEGLIVPIICRETVSELVRVLNYPKFKLTKDRIEGALADFLPWAEKANSPAAWDIKDLQDKDDAIFIHLAREAKADFLISGDKHLLRLRGAVPKPRIIAPADFLGYAQGLLERRACCK